MEATAPESAAPREDLSRPFRASVQLLRARWPLALALFAPQLLVDGIQTASPWSPEQGPLWVVALLLPIYAATGAIAQAGLALAARNGTASHSAILRLLLTRTRHWLSASLLAALVTIVGLALIVPGIYFSVIYLWVPALAALEERPGDVFAPLYFSKVAARRHKKTALLLAICALASSFVSLGVERLLKSAPDLAPWLGLLAGALPTLLLHGAVAATAARLVFYGAPQKES